MDKQMLHYLRNLRDRTSYSVVLVHGSDEVVIYAIEFRALEKAIQELEEVRQGEDHIEQR